MAIAVAILEMGFVGFALLAGTVVVQRGDAEEAHHVLQSLGLRSEFFGGAGEFFGAGSVSLRDQPDLADGAVDLIDAGRLFVGRGSDFLDQIRGFLNCGDELV